MVEPEVEESLYFPVWMAAELEAIAQKLRVSVGTIVWAAWEAAKQQLKDFIKKKLQGQKPETYKVTRTKSGCTVVLLAVAWRRLKV